VRGRRRDGLAAGSRNGRKSVRVVEVAPLTSRRRVRKIRVSDRRWVPTAESAMPVISGPHERPGRWRIPFTRLAHLEGVGRIQL
jgi:hypothetical protein